MSAMFDNALNKVPATKPACTAIVSHGACAWEMLNSSMRRGVTAVAENHNVMPRNWATRDHGEHLPPVASGICVQSASNRWLT